MNRTLAFFDRDSVDFIKTALMKVEQFRLDVNFGKDFWGEGSSRYRPYEVENGTLYIPVTGALLSRFPATFGEWATGYEYIKKAFDRGLEDSEVNRIALNIHSPGGEGAELFELVDHIYENRNVKPINAFANNNAASAAYALGSSANKFYATRSSYVGSIGAVMMHTSFEKMLENQGIEITFIYAGKHKVDGNPYEGLSDDARKTLQARVDKGYETFVASVARNRAMSDEKVRETEARVFDSDDARAIGLIDAISTFESAVSEFEAPIEDDEAMNEKTPALTQTDIDNAVNAAVQNTTGEVRKSERERLKAILELSESKGREELAIELAVGSDMSADSIKNILSKAHIKTEEKKNNFKDIMDKDDHPEVETSEASETSEKPDELGDALLSDYNRVSGSHVGARKN